MSVTTRCKTVTFSGTAGFAVMCALRQRLENLAARQVAIAGESGTHGAEIRHYLAEQIGGVKAALEAMGGAA